MTSELGYAIPRMRTKLRFGFSDRKQRRILFFFSRGTRETKHEHSVDFELLAAPELTSVDKTRQGIRLSLAEPRFVLSRAEEQAVVDRAVNLLASSRFRFGLPRSPKNLTELARHEAEAIKAAWFRREEDTKENRDGRGIVAFALDDGRHLLVRVTEEGKKDAVLELPAAEENIIIHSVDGDDADEMAYQPLHALALTMRGWILAGCPMRLRPGAAVEAAVIEEFEDACIAAHETLSRQDQDALTFYELGELAATFRYSSGFTDGRMDLDFADRGLLMENRLDITLRGGELEARTSPEFVLSGGRLAAFLKLVDAKRDKIAARLGGSSYNELLLGPEYRRGVLVLLAFEGDMPKDEFLVVWPGLHGGEPRDFVFTCKRNGGGLDDINPIIKLEESLAVKRLGVVEGDHYDKFHRFFRSVRMTRFRAVLERRS